MKLLSRLNSLCVTLAGVAILLMTLGGGTDVLFTLLFGKPIPGVYEATEALMVLVIFLSLAYLQTSGGNISVDILTQRFPRRARMVQLAAAELMGAVFFGLLAWQAWLLAVDSWQLDEYSAGLVRFPLYPAKFALAIGAALTAVCCIARLARLREIVNRKSGSFDARPTERAQERT